MHSYLANLLQAKPRLMSCNILQETTVSKTNALFPQIF